MSTDGFEDDDALDDEVEAHRMAAAGPFNTNEDVADDDVEAHALPGGLPNTNEDVADDDVEAHGFDLDDESDDDDFDD